MQRKNRISDPSHSQILVMKVQVGEYYSVLLLSLPVFQNEQSPIFFTPLISKIVLKLSVVSWVRAEGCYSIALWYGWCKKMELCSLGPADIVTRSMFTNHVYLILDLWCLFITTLPVSPSPPDIHCVKCFSSMSELVTWTRPWTQLTVTRADRV